MREMLSTTAALYARAPAARWRSCTDGRFLRRDARFCVGHVGPEAAVADRSRCSATAISSPSTHRGTIAVAIGDAELAERRKA